MARRSLRPHLNQIRGWVRQGRTDAWIAHQLEATVQQIETFKKDNDLTPVESENGEAPKIDFDDEIDLRAEDDALVAAELEAAEARKLEEERLKAEEEARRAEAGETDDEDDDAPKPAARRRGRRGGRGRATGARGTATDALEAGGLQDDHGHLAGEPRAGADSD